jgi:hypothetical protein
MTGLLVALALISFAQEELTRFSFCRASVAPRDELHCMELSASGEGLYRLESERQRPLEQPFQLSAPATEAFLELLEATDYLRDGEAYESDREVAALGVKTLVAEGVWGRREAVFNFTSRSEVTALVTFLDRLIAQELLILDIETAQRFDPLSMPETLERLERDLSMNRLVDLPRMRPILEGIIEDQRLLVLVRNHATELLEEVDEKTR